MRTYCLHLFFHNSLQIENELEELMKKNPNEKWHLEECEPLHSYIAMHYSHISHLLKGSSLRKLHPSTINPFHEINGITEKNSFLSFFSCLQALRSLRWFLSAEKIIDEKTVENIRGPLARAPMLAGPKQQIKVVLAPSSKSSLGGTNARANVLWSGHVLSYSC